jgi:hypothetical protein
VKLGNAYRDVHTSIVCLLHHNWAYPNVQQQSGEVNCGSHRMEYCGAIKDLQILVTWEEIQKQNTENENML